jgi:lipoprotein-anchoring transpeptidase ErfK/SrfK
MPPDRRPRPLNLKAAATPRRNKPRPAPKVPKKPRLPRRPDDNSRLMYWIAGILIILLIGLVVLFVELPNIQTWLDHRALGTPSSPTLVQAEPMPPKALLPPPAPTPPPPSAVEIAQKKLEAKAKADAKIELQQAEQELALEATLKATPTPRPEPMLDHPQPLGPPVAQPLSAADTKGPPARALPLDPNKLDTERIAAYQVALERMHFSCGFIDGDQGMRTQRMLRAFQTSRHLSTSGFLDQPTRDAIGEPGEPFLNYTVTQVDIDSIMPKPQTWREKSKVARLGYNDMWEMLGEKFHCTKGYLKQLNPEVKTFVAGTELIGPKVMPAAPIPKAASLRVNLGETSIEALDASGGIIAFFPCSIAKDKNKRPNGELTVKSVVPNPDYTFDPALFADAAKAEGITHKMVLPPGPRNPVGVAWIGLSLPGYGMHGTPEPENISRTQSHGCFRLANWNAEKVLKMVKVGTPIDVEP